MKTKRYSLVNDKLFEMYLGEEVSVDIVRCIMISANHICENVSGVVAVA